VSHPLLQVPIKKDSIPHPVRLDLSTTYFEVD
jgi:hypothetical protein